MHTRAAKLTKFILATYVFRRFRAFHVQNCVCRRGSAL